MDVGILVFRVRELRHADGSAASSPGSIHRCLQIKVGDEEHRTSEFRSENTNIALENYFEFVFPVIPDPNCELQINLIPFEVTADSTPSEGTKTKQEAVLAQGTLPISKELLQSCFQKAIETTVSLTRNNTPSIDVRVWLQSHFYQPNDLVKSGKLREKMKGEPLKNTKLLTYCLYGTHLFSIKNSHPHGLVCISGATVSKSEKVTKDKITYLLQISNTHSGRKKLLLLTQNETEASEWTIALEKQTAKQPIKLTPILDGAVKVHETTSKKIQPEENKKEKTKTVIVKKIAKSLIGGSKNKSPDSKASKKGKDALVDLPGLDERPSEVQKQENPPKGGNKQSKLIKVTNVKASPKVVRSQSTKVVSPKVSLEKSGTKTPKKSEDSKVQKTEKVEIEVKQSNNHKKESSSKYATSPMQKSKSHSVVPVTKITFENPEKQKDKDTMKEITNGIAKSEPTNQNNVESNIQGKEINQQTAKTKDILPSTKATEASSTKANNSKLQKDIKSKSFNGTIHDNGTNGDHNATIDDDKNQKINKLTADQPRLSSITQMQAQMGIIPSKKHDEIETINATPVIPSSTKKRDPMIVKPVIAWSEKEDDDDSPFRGAGQAPGLEIWRMEKMIPIPLPREQYGKFSREDCYIVLNTQLGPNGGLVWNIHYWLGRKTQLDKSTSAAIRAVQLNDYLKGQSVHYREVQRRESELFLSYFGYKVKYLKGGVESGMRHVEKGHYEPRLLHVKGLGKDKKLRINLVETHIQNLTKVDSYVLDTGMVLYIWNGPHTTLSKRNKALQVATQLNNDNNNARGKVITVNDKTPESTEFWKILQGTEKDITEPDLTLQSKIQSEPENDEEKEGEEQDWLYKINHVNGEIKVTPIEAEFFSKNMLDSKCCFVLDCETELFVWSGKDSNFLLKRSAVMLAEELLGMFDRVQWAPITRVYEGAEPFLFRDRFVDWIEKTVTAANSSRIAGTRLQTEIDVTKLLTEPPVIVEHTFSIEEGTDCLELWSIESSSKAVPVPEEDIGNFNEKQSFICMFSWIDSTVCKLKSIVYYWQGNEAKTQNYIAYKFGFFNLLQRKMKDEGGEIPIQVKEIQGKESDNFLQLINGRGNLLTIYKNNATKPYLFHIKRRSLKDTSIVTVQLDEAKAKYLNSGDVFIVQTEKILYVWFGSGSTKHERKFGLKWANSKKGSGMVIETLEGKEPSEFWTAIGGKTEYCNIEYLKKDKDLGRLPRLYQCSEATGVVEIEEIIRFTQSDLCDHDVMILDVYHEIFVWEGSTASNAEKNMAMEVCKQYVTKGAQIDNRSPDIPITVLAAGAEPPRFKCQFHGWTDKSEVYQDPYDMRKQQPTFGHYNDNPMLTELMAASHKRAVKQT